MTRFRLIFGVLFLFVAAWLAGCANTSAIRTESGLALDLASEGSQGFVVLKVVSTRPISLSNPKWQSIRVSSDRNGGELTDITPPYGLFMSRHVPTESLYFAKLEAGEYEISGISSAGPGPGLLMALLMSDHANPEGKLPKFRVEAGRLANLGTIVYAPEIEKEQPARMFLLNGPLGQQSAKIALLSESMRTDIPLAVGGGWTSEATADAEVKVLAQARRAVSMLNFQQQDNTAVAGAHLGQIFRRTGPQSWHTEVVDGTLSAIFSVAETRDGKVIAGGEYGEYFVKGTNGEWKAYRLSSEAGRIALIEPRIDGSLIFVAGDLRQTRVWLKKSFEDMAEAPTRVTSVEGPPDHLLSTGNAVVTAQNILGIFRQSLITHIDKQTLTVRAEPQKFWVVDWQRLPSGEVKLTRQNTNQLYASSSTDNLQTWAHSPRLARYGTYWRDSLHAMAIEPSPGFSMVGNTLMKTEDGGQLWVPSGKTLETRNYVGRIVFADSKEVLLQGGHMVYSTMDEGATWKRIFPPFSN